MPEPTHPGPTRLESDSMGRVKVPANVYWGARTARLLSHISIGHDRMQGAACYDGQTPLCY
jgi:fumarate hydratase class II